ncbi:hypothetical protein E5163_00885 [Marinicauda algicola]|uniref:Uncharacterized protein n=1 Tax=Marinicauda algicola TaxID=2029849 RepID=A0A4V6RF56_9PROT|nr:hypothetical protein [Marinicauda algicola]TGY89729.1 hypothetical protein E5163_00885 [Marinicauda algicola]
MRGKDIIGIFNLIVVAGVLGAISYAALVLQPAEYDPDTLCLVGEKPAHTVLVIDKTDLYTPAQTEAIRQLVLQARDRLAIGQRLSLYELDARGELEETPFSLCNPGRGEQINPLYRNPSRVEARYQALFEDPLQDVLADLVEPRNAPASPIIEALARIAREDAFDATTPGRDIILVSDMLQNSALFSVYGAARYDLAGRLPDPRDVAAQVEREFGYGLRGVAIEIHLIPREGWEGQQAGIIQAYWSEVFRHLGMRDYWSAV